jgi:hypothetical protein
VVSRRLALRSSGLAVLGLASHSVFGQTTAKTTEARMQGAKSSQQIQERIEQSRVFTDRLRNAQSMEERQQIMNEQMAWQRQRAFEDLKDQLHIPDQEWPVVKPRLQTVYNLVHPVSQMGRNDQPKTELEQRSRELRELLRDDAAGADQIKAKLTAFRAAKEKTNQQLAGARQTLRQLMSLRQESVLVLNGLLD